MIELYDNKSDRNFQLLIIDISQHLLGTNSEAFICNICLIHMIMMYVIISIG